MVNTDGFPTVESVAEQARRLRQWQPQWEGEAQ